MSVDVVDGLITLGELGMDAKSFGDMRGLPIAVMGAGAVSGAVTSNFKAAATLSALTGAALPLIFTHNPSASNIAIAAATSTAVGLIAHSVKHNWAQQEEIRRKEKSMTPLDKWVDSHQR